METRGAKRIFGNGFRLHCRGQRISKLRQWPRHPHCKCTAPPEGNGKPLVVQLPKTTMMTKYNIRNKRCSVSFGTPGGDQNPGVSGEGESVTAGDSRDEDTKMSDGGCKKQKRRGSFKKKSSVNVGTWNVRTMREMGKLTLLLEELKEQDMDITGLCEVRWSNEGLFTSGDHTIIYNGNNKGTNGVAIILNKRFGNILSSYNTISDRIITVKLDTKPVSLNIIQVYAPTSACTEEEIEDFYNNLQTTKDKIPKREMCIIMGDLNAKVGECEDSDNGIGPYGLGERNDRGDTLASFCRANDMIITNTLFNHPHRRRYTWISPGDQYRNQIDYIMVDKAWKSTVLDSKTRPGADCNTDHILVTAKLRLKAYAKKKPKANFRYDLDKLKDEETKEAFQIETENRFSALLTEWTAEEKLPNELWEDMKKVWAETAEALLGKRVKKPSKTYIS